MEKSLQASFDDPTGPLPSSGDLKFPLWVMLDRSVSVCIQDGNDEAAAAAAAAKQKGSADPSDLELLGSFKPDKRLIHTPPKISTFGLLGRPIPGEDLARLAYGTRVACADKSLLVLYGGSYAGPGSSARGCYLVYDTAAASPLATVPPIPNMNLTGLGMGAVVLRRQPPRAGAASSFLLAELAGRPKYDLPHAELYLWWSDAPTAQWIKKEVCLPRELAWEPGKHMFSIDAAFSMGKYSLCWVDLLRGIIVCNHPGHPDPHFRFIPLPDGCPSFGTNEHAFRPRMHEFRSVSCIGGVIMLVAVEGILEDWPSDQFRLATWTLSSGLREWKRSSMFGIQDLWARDKYEALNLPRRYTPLCPVLWESDVVYTIFNDIEIEEIFRGSEHVQTQVKIKGQYVLELDMQGQKIISISHGVPGHFGLLMPNLIATDFTAYLQGSMERQSEEESSEAEECMQRLKVK